MNSKPYEPMLSLKAAMAIRGLSVKEVANRAGLSYNYVVRLLNGFARSDPAVKKICEAIEQPAESSDYKNGVFTPSSP
jgi:transcriptional regulator with XRE-family HTH domain